MTFCSNFEAFNLKSLISLWIKLYKYVVKFKITLKLGVRIHLIYS